MDWLRLAVVVVASVKLVDNRILGIIYWHMQLNGFCAWLWYCTLGTLIPRDGA